MTYVPPFLQRSMLAPLLGTVNGSSVQMLIALLRLRQGFGGQAARRVPLHGGQDALQQLAEDVLEDAAVAIVGDFFGGVGAGGDGEGFFFSVGGAGADTKNFSRRERGDAFDIEHLVAGESERGAVFAGLELKRENAHTDEVAAMDALVAFGDDGADAEEKRALGGPVAR